MSTSKKYLFVVNPISGDVDKTVITESVTAFAKELSIEIEVYETTGDEDEAKIKKLYEEFHPERIIVAGGDGTIKLVAEAVEGSEVIIGIIPAGSANGLSVDLELPTTIEEQLEVAFHSDFIELDMICINDRKSLHLSDIGLNAELIKNYESSAIRGKLGYAIQALTTLTDAEVAFDVIVEANGDSIVSEAKMVVIANSQKYGTGVTINPLGKMDDGLFEIVIIKNLTLGIFSKIVAGNMPLETGDVLIISASSAKITTNKAVHFQVDGEYYGEVAELDITILENQMRVAVPAI